MGWWAEKGRKGFIAFLSGFLGREVCGECGGRWALFWVGSCGIRYARWCLGSGGELRRAGTDGVRAGGRRAGGSAWLELRLRGKGSDIPV